MRLRLLMVALTVVPVLAQAPAAASWPRSRPVTFVDLDYPPEALAARATGRVVVRVTTDASGRVTDAESLSGPDRLVPAVLANARQWTLSPGVCTGAIVFLFEIDEAVCNNDRRSLFRLVHPNLAVITACTGPGRPLGIPTPSSEFSFESAGAAPRYPAIAQSARIAGAVVLELSLDARGVVVDSRPLTELPFLTETAVAHSRTRRARAGPIRRGIFVYEFALGHHACEAESQTALWSWVTADYMRLTACAPLVNP